MKKENIINLAIIGTGSIAEMHARAIQSIPEARLVAVCGGNSERGKAFSEKYQVEYTADLQSLVERSDIHGVTIATISGTHADAAIPFLNPDSALGIL